MSNEKSFNNVRVQEKEINYLLLFLMIQLFYSLIYKIFLNSFINNFDLKFPKKSRKIRNIF